MVDILVNLHDCSRVLSCLGKCHQLDEHWLPLRLLRRQSVSISKIIRQQTTSLINFVSLVIWILNKGGPKPAIVTTAALLLVGNWLRYAGTRANGGIFGLAMFGQILIGFAQPFCLCAPTRYSDLWFSDHGRTSATAVASLANPLGAALGQLIDSEWATKPSDIPNMVLYITIIVRDHAHPLPHHA